MCTFASFQGPDEAESAQGGWAEWESTFFSPQISQAAEFELRELEDEEEELVEESGELDSGSAVTGEVDRLVESGEELWAGLRGLGGESKGLTNDPGEPGELGGGVVGRVEKTRGTLTGGGGGEAQKKSQTAYAPSSFF